jgi:hypothetical protein
MANLMQGAYPSAAGSLSEGLQSGFQLGLQMRKQRMDEDTAAFQKQKFDEQKNREQYIHDINQAVTMLSSGNSTIRKMGAQAYLKAQKNPLSGWDENDTKSATESLSKMGDNHYGKLVKETAGALDTFKKTGNWDMFKTALDTTHINLGQEVSGEELKQGQAQIAQILKEGQTIRSQNAESQALSALSGNDVIGGYEKTAGEIIPTYNKPIYVKPTTEEINQTVSSTLPLIDKESVVKTHLLNKIAPKENPNKAMTPSITNTGWTVYFDPKTNSQYASKEGSPPEYYNPQKHGNVPSSEATKLNVAVTSGVARATAWNDERFYPVYDTKSDKSVKVKGKLINAEPDRFIDTSDPLVGSLKNQEKIYGMMGGFVLNINKQINQVDTIMEKLNRLDVRALDMPLRELNTRIIGSGQEKVLQSYLMEISREIGKLSAGSSASIAELSVEAQKKWDSIHDPNLSLKQLKLILQATQEQANMRLDSSKEEIQITKGRMKGETPQKTKPVQENKQGQVGKYTFTVE